MGLAAWTDTHRTLRVDARGGAHGIRLSIEGSPSVSLAPVDEHTLPSAGEQYVRGNQWHVNFPQSDSSCALRLSFGVIDAAEDRMIVEACVSIQTDLMDLHPKLDIEIDCQDIDSIVPSDLLTDPQEGLSLDHDEVTGSGTAPISIAKGFNDSSGSTTVLLGPHDHPFTTNHSTDMLLRLRLFGDFLEKGVIRKARPWIVFDAQQRPQDSQLEKDWRQLSQSPLPLTP